MKYVVMALIVSVVLFNFYKFIKKAQTNLLKVSD